MSAQPGWFVKVFERHLDGGGEGGFGGFGRGVGFGHRVVIGHDRLGYR